MHTKVVRHSGGGRNPVIKQDPCSGQVTMLTRYAGVLRIGWIPASAGMTILNNLNEDGRPQQRLPFRPNRVAG